VITSRTVTNMKKIAILLLMVQHFGQSYSQTPDKTAYADLGDIRLYYEIYGKGEPLLLLHGWTQTSDFWKEYISSFSDRYRVIAIDLRGHGRSGILTDSFSIQKAAEDIKSLMEMLGLKGANAVGLSYGGLVLLELAHKHPQLLSSMILIGASANYNGKENQDPDNPFDFEQLPEDFVAQLQSVHPYGISQVKALFNKDLSYEINLSETDLGQIANRTLIIGGDRDDVVGVDAAVQLYKHLPDARLWILPNTGHLAISEPNKESFLATALEFLRSRD